MTKLFVMYRRQYGDFDIAQDIPVAASSIKEHLKIECAHKNATLSKEDERKEVRFWVSDKAELRLL